VTGGAGPGRRQGGCTTGATAPIARPVWLAPWERSGQGCDVRRECPRAHALRKWVPTPIWTLGNASGMRRTDRPEPRMGFAWRRDGTQAGWAEEPAPSMIGGNLILAVHGCLVTSIIESTGAMGFAGWVVLGVVAGWIACSIPRDCEPTQAGRLLVGVLGASWAELLPRCLAWVRLPPSSASAPGWSRAPAPPRRWPSTASASTDRGRPIRRQLGRRGSTRQHVALPNFSASAAAGRARPARWAPPLSLWPRAGRWARSEPTMHTFPHTRTRPRPRR
jgi:uncharacterized membrane protein YeaQ/YmgE (transglycosylase-associated protein family)